MRTNEYDMIKFSGEALIFLVQFDHSITVLNEIIACQIVYLILKMRYSDRQVHYSMS